MTRVTLFGPPNAGKSSLFNLLTKSHEHTGNWAGKTTRCVEKGFCLGEEKFLLKDVPGAYSVFASSDEENEAIDELLNDENDISLLVLDATSLTLSLSLLYQIRPLVDNLLIFINLKDQATENGISLNLQLLSILAQAPVVYGSVRKKEGIEKLREEIKYFRAEQPKMIAYLPTDLRHVDDSSSLYKQFKKSEKSQELLLTSAKKKAIDVRRKVATRGGRKKTMLDRIFFKRSTGLFFSALVFSLLIYLTVIFANYPSEWLSRGLGWLLDEAIKLRADTFFARMLIDGGVKTVFTVVSVMLPPMAIFFPLFALLEELGIWPRVAYNFDALFSRFHAHGKTCLLMCMGVGCNASAVGQSRIIGNKRSREKALITNSFIPCNGRFPTIIAICRLFFFGDNIFLVGLFVLATIFGGILVSLVVIRILSLFDSKKQIHDCSIIEMTPIRMPSARDVLVNTFFEKTLRLLGRAIGVAFIFGLLIFTLSNTRINSRVTLSYLVDLLAPLEVMLGLDGETLLAFILGFPANEIVLPVLVSNYELTAATAEPSLARIGTALLENGWNVKTAVLFLTFSLTHFPCATTLLTTYKETLSPRTTLLQFFVPIVVSTLLCTLINVLWMA